MKKLLLSLAAFAALSQANAQNQRMVLVEEFTQASCGPCAAQNPGFNALLEANLDKVIPIKYQTSWPGVDPMNAQTQTDVAPRVTYYAVTGVPEGMADGHIWPATGGSYAGAPGIYTQALIDAEYAVTSPLIMTMTHSLNAALDSVTINLTVTASTAVSGNLILRLAMVEKEIGFTNAPGTNGEKDFSYVMRKMYPDGSGAAFANMTSGSTVNLSWTVPVPSYIYNKAEIAFVAWVQDDAITAHTTTSNVLQAAISQPEYYPSPVPDGNVILCAATMNPTVDLTNGGSSTLTSCDLNLSYDGGANQVQSWSGSLAPGATTSVSIPQATGLSNGFHKISCYPSSPNGISTFSYAIHTKTFNYITYPSAGALSVTQNFASTTFPPAGFGTLNVGGTGVWYRANPSHGSGAGSAKADFYNITPGNVFDLYIPKSDFNLTGQTHASLDFDEAYAMYGAGYEDSLAVLVSTDCGANWTNVWQQGGATLATAPTTTSEWLSVGATQWRTYSLNLDAYVGQPNVMVKFSAISAYGNNCYVDNINLRYGAVNGINNINLNSTFNVYPNPTNNNAFLNFNLAKSTDLTIEIYNSIGQLVNTIIEKNVEAGAHQTDLNLTDLAAGLYSVNIITNEGTSTRKIVKTN